LRAPCKVQVRACEEMFEKQKCMVIMFFYKISTFLSRYRHTYRHRENPGRRTWRPQLWWNKLDEEKELISHVEGHSMNENKCKSALTTAIINEDKNVLQYNIQDRIMFDFFQNI